jgi:aspartate ammonia-lyase
VTLPVNGERPALDLDDRSRTMTAVTRFPADLTPTGLTPTGLTPTYWGSQTADAIAAFDVHGVRLSSVPLLVVALATVKDAAARANHRLGRLSRETAAAISAACRELGDGRWHDQFVVDVRHGGSPREQQANADEVIAGRARELGGTVDLADLHTDVDLHPVTLRLAVILAVHDLLDDLRRLRHELRRRAEALGEVLASEDAVLTSLRNRLGGYARDVALQERQLAATMVELHQVALPVADEDARRFVVAFTAELCTGSGLSFAVAAPVDPAPAGGSLLDLSRALKPLAVRLAQLWSGLSTLAEAGGLRTPDAQRRRSEIVNRTALDVIGAVLRDEVRGADGPSVQAEPALALSVLASLTKLGEATGAVADWCREGLGTPQASLAA